MALSIDRDMRVVTIHPPKLRIRLKQIVTELLHRYTLEELLAEIARQRPDLDIDIHRCGNKDV